MWINQMATLKYTLFVQISKNSNALKFKHRIRNYKKDQIEIWEIKME